MLRKLLSVLLSVCILLTAISVTQVFASAEDTDIAATSGGGGDGDYTCGDFTYNLLDDGTASLASYHGDATALEIPSSLDGHTVTEIGAFCFAFNDKLTSVTIPDTVTKIGSAAFYGCMLLADINIPDSVTELGEDEVFGDTPWLENRPDGILYIGKTLYMVIGECPEEVTVREGTEAIAFCAFCDKNFNDNTTLKKVVLPDSLKTIGAYAFESCVNLSEINIPDSVERIGSGAFYNTEVYNKQPNGVVYFGNCLYKIKGSCPEEVVIRDGVKYIPSYMFEDCENLKKVTIPDSVIEIGDSAFYDCTNLAEVVMSKNVETIDGSAFGYCRALKSFEFPDTLKEIGGFAFRGVTSLEEVELPDSLTKLGCFAFAYCSSLKSVKLSESLTEIEYNTFEDCDSLTSITIPATVTTIGEEAFYNCTSLETVNMPDTLTDIGKDAFKGTKWLVDTVGEGVWYVGNTVYGFLGDCPAEVTIKEGTVKICEDAFRNIDTLEKINLPSTLTEIEESAFSGCSSLKSAELPVALTKIGKYAFQECEALESDVLPASLTELGEAAFEGCSSLKSIAIPAALVDMGEDPFRNCASLESIRIDGNNPKYDSRDNCNAIIETATDTLVIATKNSVIPDGIKIIGDYAFAGLDIETASIPASVTKIGEYAFSECKKLKNISVNLEGDLTEIGYCAFEYCTSLDTVWLPYGLKRIESNAFYKCSSLRYIYGTSKLDYIGGGAFSNTLWEASFANNPMNIDKTIYLGAVIYKEVHSNHIGGKTCNPYPYTYGIYDRAYYGDRSLIQINIPDGCAYFGARAFMGCTQLKSIEIPASVTRIGEKALGYTTSGDLISGFTIYGYTYSEAERYAKDNNIKFVSIGEAPTEAPTTAPTVVPTEPVTQAPTEPATQEPTTAPTLAPVKLGDANGDGEVDSVDATIVQRAATKIQVPYSEEQLMCADVDGDGSLTIVDATFIQRYDSKIAVPYPVGEAK